MQRKIEINDYISSRFLSKKKRKTDSECCSRINNFLLVSSLKASPCLLDPIPTRRLKEVFPLVSTLLDIKKPTLYSDISLIFPSSLTSLRRQSLIVCVTFYIRMIHLRSFGVDLESNHRKRPSAFIRPRTRLCSCLLGPQCCV